MKKRIVTLLLALSLVAGALALPAGAAGDVSYKVWNQGDSRWGQLSIAGTAAKGTLAPDRYVNGVKLKGNNLYNYGCYITAIDKLLIYAGQQGTNFTPDVCLEALKKHEMLSSGGGIAPGNYPSFLKEYGPDLTYESSGSSHAAWTKEEAARVIGDKINAGYYVIVGVQKKSGAKRNGHWIAVDHVSNGEIYIMDNGANGGIIGLHTLYYGVTDQVYFKSSNAAQVTPSTSGPSTQQAPKPVITISPTTAPSMNMPQGKPFYFKGTITAKNDTIAYVTETITRKGASGPVQKVTIRPQKSSVDIATSGLDSLKFGKLEPGNYTLELIAGGSSGQSATWKKEFSIASPSSSVQPLTISPTTAPTNGMKQGSPFYFKGKITSSYTITSATISILSADWKNTFQTRTITPNTKTVDIATSGLDSLKFGKLQPGSYVFYLTAKDSSGATKSWSKAFTIVR